MDTKVEKRDLVFLWIDEDEAGIFKNQNINFGSEYVFNLERMGNRLRLSAIPNATYIPDFFTSAGVGIDNLTAIVGKNGSGKSALARLIACLVSTGTLPSSFVAIVRVSGSEKIYEVFNNLEDGAGLELDTSMPAGTSPRGDIVNLGIRDAVYYSPIIDFAKPYSSADPNHSQDVSTTQLIREEILKSHASIMRSPIDELTTLVRAMDFALHWELLQSGIGREVLSEVFGIVDEMPNYKLRFINPKSNEFLEKRVTHNFWRTIPDLIAAYQAERQAVGTRRMETNLNDQAHFQASAEWFQLEFAHHLFRFYLFHLGNYELSAAIHDIGQVRGDGFIPLLYSFFENQSAFDPSLLKECLDMGMQISGKVVEEPDQASYVLHPQDFKALFEIHSKLLWSVHYHNAFAHTSRERQEFLNFDYPYSLSSGQKAYLDLFSKLYRGKQVFDVRAKHFPPPALVVVILDEGEHGFHPAWQQCYVNSLIKGLPKIFASADGAEGPRLQVIITTHSPIALSDVPRAHVVTLDPIGHSPQEPVLLNQTFGANIHDLYRNSFFLDNHTVGQFAFEKIDAIIQDLNGTGAFAAEEVLRNIELIGEPMIRNRLMQMYHDKYGAVNSVADRIKYHEEQLRLLRKRKNNEDH